MSSVVVAEPDGLFVADLRRRSIPVCEKQLQDALSKVQSSWRC